MVEWLRGDFGRAAAAQITASRFFERFPANREKVLAMLRQHREGRANFALYLWTLFNAVAWFDTWIDKRPETRVA
jgi:hypothetical protein